MGDFIMRTITFKGELYLKRSDVFHMLREAAGCLQTDDRRFIEKLAYNIMQLQGKQPVPT